MRHGWPPKLTTKFKPANLRRQSLSKPFIESRGMGAQRDLESVNGRRERPTSNIEHRMFVSAASQRQHPVAANVNWRFFFGSGASAVSQRRLRGSGSWIDPHDALGIPGTAGPGLKSARTDVHGHRLTQPARRAAPDCGCPAGCRPALLREAEEFPAGAGPRIGRAAADPGNLSPFARRRHVRRQRRRWPFARGGNGRWRG